MRVAFLLGSGASRYSEMPSVTEITTRVLSGQNVIELSGRFRVVDDEMYRHQHDLMPNRTPDVVAFARELETLCDDYWASLKPFERDTNYEDIAYVARQIDDSILSEYENPALLPLIERLGRDIGRRPDDLQRLASLTAEYIEDVVCSMLDGQLGPVDQMTAIVDAFADESVNDITVATLNHDLVLEHLFVETGTPYADGFGREYGTLRIWNDSFDPPTLSLLKLHGSIDWWRYSLDIDGFKGQFTAKAIDGDPEHARDPDSQLLGYPALGRPLILTGTFNKILHYGSGIYADQHARFHTALNHADALVVIGYGFHDKAINSRIVAWTERPGDRRMVVVHPDPESFATTARGAIRGLWKRWQDRGVLAFVEEYLTPQTTWESISSKLR